MEILDEDSYYTREIYAYFGLAIYWSQCLERTISIALISVFNQNVKNMTSELFDFELELNFKKTLGSLLKELNKTQPFDEEHFQEELTELLKQRNWLAHHYFWDRAVHFMNKDGKQTMLEELKKIAIRFQEMDEKLMKMLQDWRRAKGVSDEEVQSIVDGLLSNYSKK
jgi:hypothetical protein